MKPNWDDAPEWATFLAQDHNGKWYWYSDAPAAGEYEWEFVQGSLADAWPKIEGWGESLESRP